MRRGKEIYNSRGGKKNKVGGTMGHDSFFCRRLGRKSDPINDALRPAVLRYAYRLNLSSG